MAPRLWQDPLPADGEQRHAAQQCLEQPWQETEGGRSGPDLQPIAASQKGTGGALLLSPFLSPMLFWGVLCYG